MRYIFYVNPIAGKGGAQHNIIDSVKRCFLNKTEEFKIYVTKAAGDALRDARREAETGDNICMFACGGEGTVFEVLNGIVGYSNVSLGVIPCGSANDFIKFFGSKKSFLDISDQIDGETVKMDLIKAGDKYCLNGCSVGMDAIVARDMSIFKNWPLVSGSFAYKLAVAKTFLGKIGITADISVDGGKPQRKNCLFAVIANAPYYGGGYNSAPDAVPYDNKLNFTLVDKISKLKIFKFLKLYKKGQHQELDYCTLKSCTTMEFYAEKPIPVNLDGEIIETDHAKFELVKNAVNFIVPKSIAKKLLTKV